MNYEMHGFPPDYISLEDPKVNIQMNYEMRVEEHSNPLVVFMHQMIPHHENAVNMARWGGRLSDYWEINCFLFQNCPETRQVCGRIWRRGVGRAGSVERHHQHPEQANPRYARLARKVIVYQKYGTMTTMVHIGAGTARKVPNIAQPLPKLVLNDTHFLCSPQSFPLPFCSLDEPTFCESREFLCSTKDEPLWIFNILKLKVLPKKLRSLEIQI